MEKDFFYNASLKIFKDTVPKDVVSEIVEKIRITVKDFPDDWLISEDKRAKIRVVIKRILRRNNYPKEQLERISKRMLKQTEKEFTIKD